MLIAYLKHHLLCYVCIPIKDGEVIDTWCDCQSEYQMYNMKGAQPNPYFIDLFAHHNHLQKRVIKTCGFDVYILVEVRLFF